MKRKGTITGHVSELRKFRTRKLTYGLGFERSTAQYSHCGSPPPGQKLSSMIVRDHPHQICFNVHPVLQHKDCGAPLSSNVILCTFVLFDCVVVCMFFLLIYDSLIASIFVDIQLSQYQVTVCIAM